MRLAEHQLLCEFVKDLTKRLEVARAHLVCDAEDQALGVVQHGIGIRTSVVGARDHLTGRLDDSPENTSTPHDGGIVLDVKGRRHSVDQIRDIRRSAR